MEHQSLMQEYQGCQSLLLTCPLCVAATSQRLACLPLKEMKCWVRRLLCVYAVLFKLFSIITTWKEFVRNEIWLALTWVSFYFRRREIFLLILLRGHRVNRFKKLWAFRQRSSKVDGIQWLRAFEWSFCDLCVVCGKENQMFLKYS